MKKLYTVLFVMAMSLLVSCDRENPDGISNEMAIKMSVSVDKTKAILTTDNIINTSIGVFGYKEQISNQNNKYLVFNNEKLSFESDSWAYSPVRYWDTQTAYSFIAYAPYQENSDDVLVNDFEGITINGIPQWQDADDAESKDYVVALTDSAATNYINNGGVDLKFHHILANLKITAFKEGDSDFEIQNITIGADIDNQRVPAVDAERSYVQNFGHERADGSFSNVTLIGIPISLFAGNMVVEQAVNVVANLLVAPFIAGADLPLTITYTENGTEKSAVVNSGITEFKSDAVYTVNLKFTATSTPEGPSGPGVEAVVDGFAIGDGDFDICLAVDGNGQLSISNISSVETSALIWNREYCEDGSGEFYMSCIYNGKKYYLSVDNSIDRLLVATENLNDALKFHIFQYPNKNPNLATYIESEGARYEYLVQHTQDTDKPVRFFLAQEKGRDEGQMMSYNSIAPSEFTKLADFAVCKVEDGFAGPLLYFQEYTNNGYDYLNRCLDINKSTLEFKIMMSQNEFSLLSYIKYNNNLTHYYYEGAANVNTPPVNYITMNSNDIESIEWTVTKTDGTTFDDNIVRVGVLNGYFGNGGKLEYLSLLPTDTDIIVSATVNFKDQTPSRTAAYRLTLKGANSSN
ncbi:MAG: fimbrillin family protein [Bacteroidaceae bacterium]|nr:fimbrillin family protein [Bacteroidaceae bacterium]